MDSLTAYLPAHGLCLTSVPSVILMLTIGDTLTAVAYYAIALFLWCIHKRVSNIPLAQPFTLLFSAFITLCGLSHTMHVVTLYIGGFAYYAELLVTLWTACISAATAVLLWSNRRLIKGMLNG